jgi:hypothetical protein
MPPSPTVPLDEWRATACRRNGVHGPQPTCRKPRAQTTGCKAREAIDVPQSTWHRGLPRGDGATPKGFTEPSRVASSGVESSRVEPSRAEPRSSRAEVEVEVEVEPSRAEVELSRAESSALCRTADALTSASVCRRAQLLAHRAIGGPALVVLDRRTRRDNSLPPPPTQPPSRPPSHPRSRPPSHPRSRTRCGRCAVGVLPTGTPDAGVLHGST